MIETLTILTLSIIAMLIFRPGKTPPLENPLTINRVGQFHAVLAPRINLAQPLLESISQRLTTEMRQGGSTVPLYFSVQDQEVQAHGKNYYLLAATLRDGVLYFQATAPHDSSNDLDTIRTFSESELLKHPEMQTDAGDASTVLINAIRTAAEQRGAAITQL